MRDIIFDESLSHNSGRGLAAGLNYPTRRWVLDHPLSEAMDTIKLEGAVFRGTDYGGVGVYTDEEYGHTYAGERNERGKAHGFGVLTRSDGYTFSGQFADGDLHGHFADHCADGDVGYALFERGKQVLTAHVRPDGACFYRGKPCGADHADFAALIAAAQQAGVRMPPTRIQRNARAVGRTATHAPFRFSHSARFWCLASARGVGRAYASVRVCMCACVCVCVCLRVRVFVRARACTIVCAWARVNVCVRVSVHMRLGVRERAHVCEFVYMCA